MDKQNIVVTFNASPEQKALVLDAMLINVARGALLDEEALYTHVKSHPDFLLGIDAWWTEPFLHGQFRMEYPSSICPTCWVPRIIRPWFPVS